jgi:hypothetical protein
LGHPTSKGNGKRWFGRPSLATEYPYYNFKKERERNVEVIRGAAQILNFYRGGGLNAAFPRKVAEPHVQIVVDMSYLVFTFRFLPRGHPNANGRSRE